MADIDIERKSSSGWLWALLGLVVLALLLFWLLGGDRQETAMVDEQAETEMAPTQPPATEQPTTAITTAPAALQDYQQRCGEPQPGQMALDHEATSQCLTMLTSAMEATLDESQRSAIQSKIDAANASARELMASGADSMEQSRMVRSAFSSIADALDEIQERDHPQLEGAVEQLDETVESIDPGQSLQAQREPVQRFFQQAGNVLNRMVMPQTA